jgi:methylenetetrahydrofolate dehydrogenase (NADP+)/methenyltetrahydrofolate cyclohydrolase
METAMIDIAEHNEKAQLINGKAVALAMRQRIKEEVAALSSPPGLAMVFVGNDPGSEVYVRNKIRASNEVGIESTVHRFAEDASADEVADIIEKLNNDNSVHGILLQLPLPEHLADKSNEFINMIDPDKDVDGLTIVNMGRLVAGMEGIVPCTPASSLHLIHSVQEKLRGMHAVIISHSLLFGKPMAQLLLAEDVTVTTAHAETRNLPEITKQADILISATGQAQLIKGDWIKPGAIVIDVGIIRIPNPDGGKDKLVGDVLFAEAVNVASAITPVPGGVGPMTIAYLLQNTLHAAQRAGIK